METIYKEIILDHYRNPRNKGKLGSADIVSSSSNPSCGDELTMYINLNKGVIEKISFEAVGCVISVASASMLTEYVIGKKANNLLKLNKDFIQKLVNVELSPTRLKCAMLSLETLHKALKQK